MISDPNLHKLYRLNSIMQVKKTICITNKKKNSNRIGEIEGLTWRATTMWWKQTKIRRGIWPARQPFSERMRGKKVYQRIEFRQRLVKCETLFCAHNFICPWEREREREREKIGIKKNDKTLKRYLLLLLLLKISLDQKNKKRWWGLRERERGPIRPSLRSVVIGVSVCIYRKNWDPIREVVIRGIERERDCYFDGND